MSVLSAPESMAVGSRKEANNDNSLVLRAINGDQSAFETLVIRHRRVVLRVARRLTSDADGDDVTQQTFLKAFAKLSSFRFNSGFRTWLMSIAINEARQWNRKTRRQREIPLVTTGTEEDPPQTFDFPDSGPGPERQCSAEEWDQILHSEIDRLNPQTRQAIRTCDLEEVSIVDAALLFGVTVAALKSRRSRGRAILREKLLRHLPTQPLLST